MVAMFEKYYVDRLVICLDRWHVGLRDNRLKGYRVSDGQMIARFVG